MWLLSFPQSASYCLFLFLIGTKIITGATDSKSITEFEEYKKTVIRKSKALDFISPGAARLRFSYVN